MAEYRKHFSKGPEALLQEVSIKDGKIRFTTDTGRLFIDTELFRIEISDFIKDYTEEELMTLYTIYPRFYFTKDTHKVFIHNGEEWVKVLDEVSLAEEANHAKNADTAIYSEKASSDADGNDIIETYAPLNSPVFTGEPEVPTPASTDNSTKIANTEYVTTAILNAIAKITQFDFSIVTELPEEGVKGTFYLMLNSGSETDNVFDEYIWLEDKFEKVGSTRVILTGYYHAFEITGTGNAITKVEYDEENDKLVFYKEKTFLTEHPDITTNASTTAENPIAGETIELIESIEVDENGHITDLKRKSLTLPANASTSADATHAKNADTATYSVNASTAVYAKNASTAVYSDNAKNADSATYSENAGTASYSNNAGTSSYANNASTSSYSDESKNASTAIYAKNASTASYADNARNADTATYSENAGMADFAAAVSNDADLDFGDLDEEDETPAAIDLPEAE